MSNDFLVGTPSNDHLFGGDGDDVVEGGGGNDTIYGGTGNDAVHGQDGDDYVDGGDGDDLMTGGTGADVLVGGTGQDRAYGGDGNDYVAAGDAADTAYGEAGNDNLNGDAGDDYLDGGSEDDQLFGGLGRDVLIGGLAADFLDGGADGDFIYGGDGNDRAYGGDGDDVIEGGAGNEVLYGDAGNDAMHGQDGDDYVDGGDGADLLTGAAGNDVLVGGNGANNLFGGDGADYIVGGSDTDTVYGDAGDDRIFGGLGGDYLDGGLGADYSEGNGGTDVLIGGQGADVLNGGDGDDYVYAGSEADYAVGGLGNDTLYGDAGADTLNGDAGADYLDGGSEDDQLFGGTESDVIVGGLGNDFLDGGDQNDFVYGGDGDDRIYGAAGADTVEGGAGSEVVYGGAGDDLLHGQDGNDYIESEDGDDTLTGGAGADVLIGGLGVDRFYGGTENDYIAGGDGDDVAYGEAGDDTINGDAGNDYLDAGAGADLIFGGAGLDTLLGADGIDYLDGGLGADTIAGGADGDSFAFTAAIGGGNIDTITDFTPGVDRILLAGAPGDPFANLATGTLAASAFLSSTSDPYAGAALPSGPQSIVAADLNDYILYNRSSGALYYDADGSGAGAAVQFATLAANLNLTAADFLVIGPPNNAPAVTSGASASVAENSAASTIVYQSTATDADGDRITWSLTGTDASLLTIDANGAVRLNNPADYETKTSYSFNVVASDSNTGTAKAVTLTITDVSDTPQTPIINETAAANDAIGQAQVINRATLIVATNSNLFNDDYPSATIVGSISVPSDKDFFSITLQAGELIVLDVDGTSGGLDAFLSIYGPNLQLIGDNDDLISFDPGSVPTIASHNTDSQIRFRAGSSGTYYFSIASFSDDQGPTSSGGYQLHVSVGPQATPQQIVQEDIEAMVSGSAWDHTNLTYGFPSLASYYPTSFTEPDDGFQPFTALQQAATRQLLQLVANVTQLTFVENTVQDFHTVAGAAANANLRYAMSNEPDVAYAYYPSNGGSSSLGGSAWFNPSEFTGPGNDPVRGSYTWMGILHETGHALGLKHGHEFPVALSADRDSTEYTVMTYRSFPGDDAEGYNNETWGYPQTLMMYDIAGLQQMYGANYGFNAGNSVYMWSPTTGEMSINGVGQGAPGNGAGGSANRVFMTIWDGGGEDTYDMSNYGPNSVTIDLRPGEWSQTISTQLANLGSGHLARGNIANALLYNGNAASLIENAIGGSGSDRLIANQVANHLTGGSGSDIFRWVSVADSTPGAGADTVMDFHNGVSDLIDLTTIDANSTTGANDAFNFIGTAAFSNVAGQLRYDVIGGNAHIFADVDGNGVADMQIILNNITFLGGGDFNL